MVTVYIPAESPVMQAVVAPPGAHRYVYAGVTPEGETQIAPVLNPHAESGVEELSLMAGIFPTETVFVRVQLLASATVTV